VLTSAVAFDVLPTLDCHLMYNYRGPILNLPGTLSIYEFHLTSLRNKGMLSEDILIYLLSKYLENQENRILKYLKDPHRSFILLVGRCGIEVRY
jgi:hypothetical protein